MSALSTDAMPETANRAKPGSLGSLLLARVACSGGGTRAQLVRDLGPFVSSKLSPAELRSTIDAELTRLLSTGLVRNDRSRYRATEAGADATARFLREKNRMRVLGASNAIFGSSPRYSASTPLSPASAKL